MSADVPGRTQRADRAGSVLSLLSEGESVKSMFQGSQGYREAIEPGDPTVAALAELGVRLRAENAFRESAQGGETLLAAIEAEIVPRLLLAHRTGRPVEARERLDGVVDADDRAGFLEMVLREPAELCLRFAQQLLERGVPSEVVLLDLLTFTARRLGDLWDEDRCDFATVTIGLCRLHHVLREVALAESAHVGWSAQAPSVLLSTACSDQHLFGVVMVAEFFRRDGWLVSNEPAVSCDHLCALISQRDFDVVGVSAACGVNVDGVLSEVETLRKASRNSKIKVLVGGRLFAETPELVPASGADGTAADASIAPVTAKELVSRS